MKPENDAYGQEVWGFFQGKEDIVEIVERDDGYVGTSSGPAAYFRPFAEWPTVEQEARPGMPTAESHRRTQSALNALWPLAQQLFVPLPGQTSLENGGIVPGAEVWHKEWLTVVRPFLAQCNLTLPVNDNPPATSRATHSEHLAQLLADLQQVARLEQNAKW